MKLPNGRLYLIPSVIADETQTSVLSPAIIQVLPGISHFLVENVRTARRFLSSLKVFEKIDGLDFQVLDKNTKAPELKEMLSPLFEGKPVAVLSESGCPGIADPGALAVRFAHENGIDVIPLVGPSSVLLSLMASGLDGQRFAFHGYLPIESKELARAIRDLERESAKRRQTQLFIETPYRNNAMMKALLAQLQENTLVTVALDITGPGQFIKTMTAKKWKEYKPEFPKSPAVFLLLSQ